MEFAVYRVFWHGDGRKMGALVDVFPSREEAKARARGLEGEHEVVGLRTREISAEEGGLWATVVFLTEGVAAAEGLPDERGRGE